MPAAHPSATTATPSEGAPALVVTPATPTPPVHLDDPSSSSPPPPAPASITTTPTLNGTPFELELLLVSGLRRRWTFGSGETVGEAKRRVWADWPEEWQKTEPRPPSVHHLRFLYLGRFLEDTKTLSSYDLPPRSASSDEPDSQAYLGPKIVHLHIRTLPPPEGALLPLFLRLED
ncbi:hypothetical protein JCM11251_002909 [Rhodosporidiobolus azoricus]